MKPLVGDFKRIVIKLGSSLFCTEGACPDLALIKNIVEQISSLIKEGKEIVLVSSGAIALGMGLLKYKQRPTQLNYLQSISAIGQNKLMDTYQMYFQEQNIHVAQILLTWEDFDDRIRYLNAKNTIQTLLNMKNIIPIINENDTISTDEIKFGDNDRLSALVSSLISADMLIILSDVGGLIDKEKRVIRVIDEITPQIKALASPTKKKTSVGGMVTKIEAAKIATDSGIPCVIADGRRMDIISSVINAPGESGTLFVPKKGMGARGHWIAFGAKSKGLITVDDGAKRALMDNKSLLAVGITSLEGNFDVGDIVTVIDSQNFQFARGKVRISSKELDKVKGGRADKEVIHCNDIVIL